jgi:hypothetical protein
MKLTLIKRPVAFEKYEIFKAGKWERVTNGITGSKDSI